MANHKYPMKKVKFTAVIEAFIPVETNTANEGMAVEDYLETKKGIASVTILSHVEEIELNLEDK